MVQASAVLATVTGVVSGLLPRRSKAAPPVWSTIPNQVWVVGQPVNLDIADYVTDPEDDPLTFELEGTLPPGVTLNGSVISGTPTTPTAQTVFKAIADDGEIDYPLSVPTGLKVL